MPASAVISPYLDYPAVAERLGLSIHTVRRLVKDEGLPTHVFARRVKFLPDEVDEWVRTRESASRTAPDPYREAVRKLVDQAPPLSAEQADRIASILRGGR